MANKKNAPTCALIIIGNEILSGRTPDQNLNYIARRMTSVGIRFMEARVIPDVKSTIVSTVKELSEKYNYIFTTGGIGPTHDDITVVSVAEAFSVPTFRDEQTVKLFHEHYGDKVTEATFKMAIFPQGSRLIRNDATIAPGFQIQNVFCFAGIPRIMQNMLEVVIPSLEHGEDIFSQSLDVFIGESVISKGFEEIQNLYPNVELGSYPFKAGGKVGTSLVGRSTDRENLDLAFGKIKSMLNELGVEIRSS